MKIIINGNEKEINDLQNLQEIVQLFSRDNQSTIVELNGKIIPLQQQKSRKLRPGDRLELIQLVGGG